MISQQPAPRWSTGGGSVANDPLVTVDPQSTDRAPAEAAAASSSLPPPDSTLLPDERPRLVGFVFRLPRALPIPPDVVITPRDPLLEKGVLDRESQALLGRTFARLAEAELRFGLSHGDPSPWNVILGDDGVLRVLDWCRGLGALTRIAVIVGHPRRRRRFSCWNSSSVIALRSRRSARRLSVS